MRNETTFIYTILTSDPTGLLKRNFLIVKDRQTDRKDQQTNRQTDIVHPSAGQEGSRERYTSIG